MPSFKVFSIAATHVYLFWESIPLSKQNGLILYYQVVVDSGVNGQNGRLHNNNILHSFSNWLKKHRKPKWFLQRTTMGWIAMKFATEIHRSQRMYPNDFLDPLTFYLVPPWATFVAWSKMPQQLLGGLSWNSVHTFMFPSGWVLITLVNTFRLAGQIWFMTTYLQN